MEKSKEREGLAALKKLQPSFLSLRRNKNPNDDDEEFGNLEKEYVAIAKKYPKVANIAYYQAGLLLTMIKEYKRASIHLEKCGDFPVLPLKEEARYALAQCYHELGEYDKALGIYNVITKSFSSRFPFYMESMSETLAKKGAYREAADVLEKLSLDYPDYYRRRELADWYILYSMKADASQDK